MPRHHAGASAAAPVRRARGGRPGALALALAGAAAVLAAAALTAAYHSAAQSAATGFTAPHGVAPVRAGAHLSRAGRYRGARRAAEGEGADDAEQKALREAEAKQREAEASARELQATVRELKASLEGRDKKVSRAEAMQRKLESSLESKERELEALEERKGQELAEAERSVAEAERGRAAADTRYGGMLAMLKVVGDKAQEAIGGEAMPDLAEQREAALEVARANAQNATEMEEEIKLAQGKLAQMQASLDMEKGANRSAALEAANTQVKLLNKALRGIAKESGAYDASNLFGFLDSRSGDELVQDILVRVDALMKKGR